MTSAPPTNGTRRAPSPSRIALRFGIRDWAIDERPERMFELAEKSDLLEPRDSVLVARIVGRGGGGDIPSAADVIAGLAAEDEVRLSRELEELIEDSGPPASSGAWREVLSRLEVLRAGPRLSDLAKACAEGRVPDLEAAEALALEAVQAPATRTRPRLGILGVDELSALPPTKWLVRGLLPEGGFVLLYGPSGAGKSFVGLDLALCIASGRAFHGVEVRQAPVLYVAAEGSGGFAARIQAWRAAYGESEDLSGFGVLPSPVAFFEDAPGPTPEGVLRMLERREMKPGLIVLDTLNRCYGGGDENAAADAGRFAGGCARLTEATGATVLVVHHAGKFDTKTERGSSALRAAADAVLALSSEETGEARKAITVSVTKQKDGEGRAPLELALIQVELPAAPDGDRRTSCVLRSRTPAEAAFELSGPRKAVLDALMTPSLSEGASRSELVALTGLTLPTFHRAADALIAESLIQKKGRGTYRLRPQGFTSSQVLS